jgi:serine protease Do
MRSFFVKFRQKPMVLALAVVLGVGGVATLAANHPVVARSAGLALKIADSNETSSRNSFSPAVRAAQPSLVNISSAKVTQARQGMPEQGSMDPFFRRFFGEDFGGRFQVPKERREQSLGSGVIVTPDGYILTNNHVIDGATDIRVTLMDKREFKATLVGGDAKTDIALLKIDATGLPAITFADSSKVQVGDYALALGNPFGVGQTVTMGIVSATGRGGLGIEDYEDFIQTDAPINPGNSGGALVNDRGELIGVNTAIISPAGGNHGVGFAVPANLARHVMDELVADGRVTRAYLGIVPQDVTPAISKAFGVKENRGALVGDVTPDGPAAKAGIEKGDIILEVNGKPVEDSNRLRMSISMMKPGSNVDLKILRAGAEKQLGVQLGELPGEVRKASNTKSRPNSSLNGLSVENLDASVRSELNLPENTTGVVVTEIDPASNLAASGIRRGDVIQEVNRQPVKNVADFEKATAKASDSTLLLVNRQGITLYVAV